MEYPTKFVDLIQRMGKDELADALMFVEACAKGGTMRPEEFAEYRRQISARVALLRRIRRRARRHRRPRSRPLTGN